MEIRISERKKTKKVFYETNGKKSEPQSSKLQEEDTIYVAETGGGSIYAKCVVKKIHAPKVFNNLSEVIRFRRENKSPIDDKFFLDRLDGFEVELTKNNKARFIIQFYETDQEILPQSVSLTGELETLKWWQGINELKPKHLNYISKPDLWIESDLKPNISSLLRTQLWSYFTKRKGIGHIVDIDHFVPKSVGAPGNIVENLVPIGFSLNRYKSDSIPKGFFEESQDFF